MDKPQDMPHSKSHAITSAERLVKRIDTVLHMLKDQDGREMLDTKPLAGLRKELIQSIHTADIMAIGAIAMRADKEIEKIGLTIKDKALALLKLVTPDPVEPPNTANSDDPTKK